MELCALSECEHLRGGNFTVQQSPACYCRRHLDISQLLQIINAPDATGCLQ
jgi:hypothetical protein